MTVNIPEVLVANGSGIVMMVFLLLSRIRHYGAKHAAEQLFNGMLIGTLAALISETVSFLIDGQTFLGSVFLLYLSNTMCTGLTVTVGFFWCLFVNFHIYCNKRRTAHKAAVLGVPLAAVYLLLIINLFGNGILFQIQEDGVYVRGKLSFIMYVILFADMIESVAEVHISRRKGVTLFFFPVYYFVVPCVIGTIIQGLCYGLATGWLSTAVACTFVNTELQTGTAFLAGKTVEEFLYEMDHTMYAAKRDYHRSHIRAAQS